VCSGYAQPGQTGWALIDSLAVDVVLDLAYGEILAGLDPEHRAEMERTFAAAAEEAELEAEQVEVKRKSTGEVVQISQARLAQLRRNAGQ
jgi:hypothetical protein